MSFNYTFPGVVKGNLAISSIIKGNSAIPSWYAAVNTSILAKEETLPTDQEQWGVQNSLEELP